MRQHLNRRLVLEAPVRVGDGGGGAAVTWAALGTLWGSLVPGGGRLRQDGEGAVSDLSCRITVRAAPPGAPQRPEAGQRLRAGGRVFAITAVSEADARGRYLLCFATEEVAQ